MTSDIPQFLQEWINDFVANAYEGNFKEVKAFAGKYPQLIDFHDEHHTCAALSAAASTGQVDIVDYLLATGASLDARDEKDWTPLHYAAAAGRAVMVKKLLEAGADINACSKGGLTAAEVSHAEDVRSIIAAWGDAQRRSEAALSAGTIRKIRMQTPARNPFVKRGPRP